jgi:hypothetical protein
MPSRSTPFTACSPRPPPPPPPPPPPQTNTHARTHTHTQGNADALLEESAESKRERQEIIGVFEASKQALKIISEVDMKTKVPPSPHTHIHSSRMSVLLLPSHLSWPAPSNYHKRAARAHVCTLDPYLGLVSDSCCVVPSSHSITRRPGRAAAARCQEQHPGSAGRAEEPTSGHPAWSSTGWRTRSASAWQARAKARACSASARSQACPVTPVSICTRLHGPAGARRGRESSISTLTVHY